MVFSYAVRETLPFHVQTTTDGNSRLSTRLRRMWRRLPRMKRVLLPLFCIMCFVGIVYSFGSSVNSDAGESNDEEFQKVQENLARIQEAKQGGRFERPEDKTSKEDSLIQISKSDFSGPQNERQRAVVKAFQHAWSSYKTFAWGHDTLKPQSRSFNDWFDTGLTIVDALDTAIVMGLDREVREGTEWIEHSLSFDKDRYVNLFEITIRVLGGLLSSFHLTGNKMFVTRAEDLADRLLAGFTRSKSVVPLSDVNLAKRSAKGPSWSAESSLSEVTTLQLEFREISRLTGNDTYEKTAFRVSQHVHEIGCAAHDGLCDMFINADTGKFKEKTAITFGARADSYYEYLLKQWLQTGKTIDWLREDYEKAMNATEEKLVRKSEPNKFTYLGELLPPDNSFSPKMDHLVCFLSGTLGLGVQNGFPQRHMEIAEGLAEACHEMYKTPTGLAPEIAHFNMLPGTKNDISIKPLDAHCLLRPEAIEAWFYMYRFTGNKKYQDWGWEAFEAIEKYARLSTGYSSVNSVKKIPVTYRDMMESFFLAETLKYLYLLFDDDRTLLPLDKWVFNTEGHPLPIRNN